MFCPQCGKKLEDGAAFCSGCGARLNDAAMDLRNAAAVQPAAATSVASEAAAVPEPPQKKDRGIGLWMLIVAAFLVLVAVLLLPQCSKGIEKTWYQENDYYGYSATLTIRNGSYEMKMGDQMGTGTAQISGDSCVLDGEYEYALSPDGSMLTCTNNSGTNMYAGEWFASREDAAKFPRRQ